VAPRREPVSLPSGHTTSGVVRAQPFVPSNALQLFLRYEKDQHDLVKEEPGPCG
jgi:hypothetical protein